VRDRARIALMCYTFARVSAVTNLRIEDYLVGKRQWIRLHEKGGKRHEVPAHRHAEEYLDAYLDVAGIREEKQSPLFRSVDNRRQITANAMARTDVLRMVKRRAKGAGLPLPPAATRSGRRGSRRIWRTGDNRERATDRGARIAADDEALRPDWRFDEVERIAI
jgi:integrase